MWASDGVFVKKIRYVLENCERQTEGGLRERVVPTLVSMQRMAADASVCKAVEAISLWAW